MKKPWQVVGGLWVPSTQQKASKGTSQGAKLCFQSLLGPLCGKQILLCGSQSRSRPLEHCIGRGPSQLRSWAPGWTRWATEAWMQEQDPVLAL